MITHRPVQACKLLLSATTLSCVSCKQWEDTGIEAACFTPSHNTHCQSLCRKGVFVQVHVSARKQVILDALISGHKNVNRQTTSPCVSHAVSVLCFLDSFACICTRTHRHTHSRVAGNKLVALTRCACVHALMQAPQPHTTLNTPCLALFLKLCTLLMSGGGSGWLPGFCSSKVFVLA